MSPRKLSEADKRDILKLYREPGETTSTLATRYDVSNSTISRLLKSRLSGLEYEALVHQKRSNRGHNHGEELEEIPVTELQSEPEPENIAEISDDENAGKIRRRRFSGVAPRLTQEQEPAQLSLPLVESLPLVPAESFDENDDDENEEELDDDLDYEDGDLEDGDEDDWEEDRSIASEIFIPKTKNNSIVQVLPLSTAQIPKICYLVIDRAAELIARPLKDFSDLGKIPAEEVLQRTLPVFDNHRVARRFSNRAQRVIKVPDGRMLQKAGTHLQAKGITRLLIDGQVYSF
jgi:transposase-like protein